MMYCNSTRVAKTPSYFVFHPSIHFHGGGGGVGRGILMYIVKINGKIERQ